MLLMLMAAKPDMVAVKVVASGLPVEGQSIMMFLEMNKTPGGRVVS
jgi:hypothetical protein